MGAPNGERNAHGNPRTEFQGLGQLEPIEENQDRWGRELAIGYSE